MRLRIGFVPRLSTVRYVHRILSVRDVDICCFQVNERIRLFSCFCIGDTIIFCSHLSFSNERNVSQEFNTKAGLDCWTLSSAVFISCPPYSIDTH